MTPDQFSSAMAAAAEKLRSPASLMAKIGNVALAGGKKRTPVRTGLLRQSEGMRSDSTSATLYASAPYAEFVHSGTSRMQARPFFMEGVQDSLSQIEAIVREYGEQVLGGVGG